VVAAVALNVVFARGSRPAPAGDRVETPPVVVAQNA
jgi:hypothetical protein